LQAQKPLGGIFFVILRALRGEKDFKM